MWARELDRWHRPLLLLRGPTLLATFNILFSRSSSRHDRRIDLTHNAQAPSGEARARDVELGVHVRLSVRVFLLNPRVLARERGPNIPGGNVMKKLRLNRETVRQLTTDELAHAQGGKLTIISLPRGCVSVSRIDS